MRKSLHGEWALGICSMLQEIQLRYSYSQQADGHRGQDEKVVLIVHGMKGYNLKLAALQEMKCFSDEVHTKQEESLC